MKLQLDQRIYYTGDMANCEDLGTIVAVHAPTKFSVCESYDIQLDDGRKMCKVFDISFDSSPGRRFWPLDEWTAARRKSLEQTQARMLEVLNRKGGAK